MDMISSEAVVVDEIVCEIAILAILPYRFGNQGKRFGSLTRDLFGTSDENMMGTAHSYRYGITVDGNTRSPVSTDVSLLLEELEVERIQSRRRFDPAGFEILLHLTEKIETECIDVGIQQILFRSFGSTERSLLEQKVLQSEQ